MFSQTLKMYFTAAANKVCTSEHFVRFVLFLDLKSYVRKRPRVSDNLYSQHCATKHKRNTLTSTFKNGGVNTTVLLVSM